VSLRGSSFSVQGSDPLWRLSGTFSFWKVPLPFLSVVQAFCSANHGFFFFFFFVFFSSFLRHGHSLLSPMRTRQTLRATYSLFLLFFFSLLLTVFSREPSPFVSFSSKPSLVPKGDLPFSSSFLLIRMCPPLWFAEIFFFRARRIFFLAECFSPFSRFRRFLSE